MKLCFFQVCFRDKLISLDEYLEDGGWEGEAREEWSKEFLDVIDISKDGFLDRAEVRVFPPLFLLSSIIDASKYIWSTWSLC